MTSHSRRRSSTERAGPERRKHARTQQYEPPALNPAGEIRPDLRTPSPTAGTKRTSTDSQADEEEDAKPVIDSRAIYETNKKEIDEWYDQEYSRKLGIPKHNKVKHSKAKWFVKVDAWLKHKGLAQSPKKKRKLNNGTAVSNNVQAQLPQARPPRPHYIRYPGDIVAVPEYPFDKLEDFEPMSNGRYACSHINRNPLSNCCINGMDIGAKRQAISKSIFGWQRKVEKLIDKGQLNEKHMTWENWYTPHLREKYQPELYRAQEKKKAEKAKREREEQRQQAQRKAKMSSTATAMQTVSKQAYQQRQARRHPSPATHAQHHSPSYPPTQALEPPTVDCASRAIAHMRHRSISKDKATDQATKAGKYAQCAHQAAPQPPPSDQNVGLQGSRASSRMLSQQLPIPIPQTQSSLPANAGIFDDFSEETATRAVSSEGQLAPHVPFEIWDHEKIDSELDRILTTRPSYPAELATRAAEPVPQEAIPLRSEASYLSSLPQVFATGRKAVDDEMQNLLEYAYQTGTTTLQNPTEDELLLRTVVNDNKADWQRYHDFFANGSNTDEPTQAAELPALTEETEVDRFDFGKALTEDQSAV